MFQISFSVSSLDSSPLILFGFTVDFRIFVKNLKSINYTFIFLV